MIRFHLFCFFFLINFLTFSQVELVKEFGETVYESDSTPRQLITFKGHLYYVFNKGEGSSIWRLKEDSESPILFYDPSFDQRSYKVQILGVSEYFLFFLTYSYEYGTELWRTDGTIEGTLMIKDVFSGQKGLPKIFKSFVFNNELYLMPDLEESLSFCTDLWRTSGEINDFEKVIVNGENGILGVYKYTGMYEFQNELFLTLVSSVSGYNEIHKINNNGQFIKLAVNSSISPILERYNCFFTDSGLYICLGNKLFQLNNSKDSLNQVVDFGLIDPDFNLSNMFRVGNKSYINSFNSNDEYTLYVSDGTQIGTSIVDTSNYIITIKEFNGELFIFYHNRIDKFDPVNVSYTNVYLGNLYDYSVEFFESDSNLFLLNYNDFPNMYSLLKYNSDLSEFNLLKKFSFYMYETFNPIFNGYFIEFDDSYFLSGSDSTDGVLFKFSNEDVSQPTIIETSLKYEFNSNTFETIKTDNYIVCIDDYNRVYKINKGKKNITFIDSLMSFSLTPSFIYKDKIYYVNNFNTGNECVIDVQNNSITYTNGNWGELIGVNSIKFFVFQNDMFYSGIDSNNKLIIYKLNLLNNEKSLLLELENYSFNSDYRTYIFNNQLYFSISSTFSNIEIWKYQSNTDSFVYVSTNTYVLNQTNLDANPTIKDCNCSLFVGSASPVGGFGMGLIKIDSLSSQLSYVRELEVDQNWLANYQSKRNIVFNNEYYFWAKSESSNDLALWKSNGFEEGTIELKNFENVNFIAPDLSFHTIENKLLFIINDSVKGYQLWQTDGTHLGTFLLKSIFIEPYIMLNYFDKVNVVELDEKLYYNGCSEEFGVELWVSDGTVSGTKLFQNFRDSSISSFPYNFIQFDNSIYFFTFDQEHKTSMWMISGDKNKPSAIQVDTPTIFPNPSSSSIQIVSPEEQSYIRIFDLTGKLVYDKVVSGTQNEVDISTYRAGLYIAQIESTGQFQSVRFIKL